MKYENIRLSIYTENILVCDLSFSSLSSLFIFPQHSKNSFMISFPETTVKREHDDQLTHTLK